MLVVLARLGSPETVGMFTLGVAITAPIIIFTNLHLRVVQLTDVRGEYPFSDCLGLRLACTALALCVISVVACTQFSGELAATIFWIGLAKSIEALSDVFHGQMQRNEHMRPIACSLAARGLTGVAFSGLALLATGSVSWAMAGLCAGNVLIFFAGDVLATLRWSRNDRASAADACNVAVSLRPRWQVAKLGALARRAAPLAIVMTCVSLNVNVPRYFLESTQGPRQLGIFASMAYLVVLGDLLVTSLGQSASSRLAKYHAAGKTELFRSLVFRLLLLVGVLGSGGIALSVVFGRELLVMCYGRDFADGGAIFPWIAAAGAIGYIGSVLGVAITATGAFKQFVAPYAGVALISVIASSLLIPGFGLAGAAWTLCIVALANCAAPLLVINSLRRTHHG